MPSFQCTHTVLPSQAPLPMVTTHKQAACEELYPSTSSPRVWMAQAAARHQEALTCT